MASDTTHPVARVDPVGVSIEPAAVDPDAVVAGDPRVGWTSIPGPPGIDVGIWEHTVGTSIDIEEDEAFVVVSGCATVMLDDGRSFNFGPGDIGVLRAGTRTTWIVHETFRKVFVALIHTDDV